MCGFIGLIGEKDVSRRLYTGLLTIQHRGQDSAGMITYSGRFNMKKGNGLVRDVFNEKNLSYLKGNIGIAHVRYPTVGGGGAEDAQPFYVSIPYGIILAHNGNIVNYFSLKEEMEKKYYRDLNSTSDAELLLHVLAEELSRRIPFSIHNLFRAVEGVFKRALGSYSAVAYIRDRGFLAFRDPNGFKPIVFGQKGKEFIFASESVVLDTLGFKLLRDLYPGEAIFIDKNGRVYKKRVVERPQTSCIFEYVYFARPDSIIDGISVYEARLRLGRMLAEKIRKANLKIDVIIPVPDTSRAAAVAISEELGIPYREGFIKNRYIGRTFIMPSQELRQRSIRLKLNPIKEEFLGKNVLIIDDSIVRGNTSKEIISLVREMGAAKVYLGIYSPPLKYPCFYGIDMQTRGEFIAAERSVDEIKKYIGADELIYQDMHGLIKGVFGSANAHCCCACFSGEYPVPVPEYDMKRIQEDRTKKESEKVE